MTEDQYHEKLIVVLRDLHFAANSYPNEPRLFNEALARYTSLNICYLQGKRRRPWAALIVVLILLIVLIFLCYTILTVLFIGGTT